jgi:hypothetical protein
MTKYSYYIILLSLFLLSCKEETKFKTVSHNSRYGVTFNPIRQFIGLEPLNMTWESCVPKKQHNLIRIDWWYKKGIKYNQIINKSFYGSKVIWFDFDIPIKEADLYISSNCFDAFNIRSQKIKVNKVLYYIYQYVPDNLNKIGWSYYYSTDSNDNIRGNITKSEADSILYSWGLTRPQY